jgi:hypothetical protein
VEGLIGAERHETTAERATSSNGYRDRTLDTCLHPRSGCAASPQAADSNAKLLGTALTNNACDHCNRLPKLSYSAKRII